MPSLSPAEPAGWRGTAGPPESAYAVIPADLARDREDILSLWRMNSPIERNLSCRFRWNYLEPRFPPARCWLLAARKPDRLVGSAGLLCRRFSLGGSIVQAGLVSDFVVDREHRFLQPALLLQKAVASCLGEGTRFIYGMPNRTALGVFRRLGYEIPAHLVRFPKLLRLEHYLSPAAWIPPKLLSTASYPLNLILRFSSPGEWRRMRGTVVEEIASFDARFDDLWLRASGRYRLIGERSSEFLRWRYLECPTYDYTTLGLLTNGGERLAGYVVIRPDEGSRARIIDALMEEGDDIRNGLIAAAIAWARARKFASLSADLLAAGELAAGLRRFGFWQPNPEAGPLVVREAAQPGGPPLPSSESWYFTRGDEDFA